MKRIGFLMAVACAIAGAAVTARAQSATNCYSTPCVFTAVDAVAIQSNSLYVTGLLEGQATPVQGQLIFSSADGLAACERLALLAISRPGEYQLRLSQVTSSTVNCRLSRVVP